MSFNLYDFFNICDLCFKNHSSNLACYQKRDKLSEEHLCIFCNEQYSSLDDHFDPDDKYPTIRTCQELIQNDFDDHFCEPRAKAMTINRHRDICEMCVKEQFPNGANQENTQSVECKDFLHSTWFCRRFCVFCYQHNGKLVKHDYQYCRDVSRKVKYELEEIRDREYGFD